MPVLIDPPAWPAHGRLWSHLVSDTSYDELHDFAGRAGIPRRAFEGDHYDVPEERYDALVAAGARPVPSRDLLRALQASGLRIPKRKGERVLVSTGDAPWLPRPHRLDLVASRLSTPEALTAYAGVIALAGGGSGRRVLLTQVADRGWDLPGGHREDGEDVPGTAVRELAEGTGVVVPSDALRPVGHQRVTLLGEAPSGYRYPAPVAYLAVLVTEVGRPVDVPGPTDGESVAAAWWSVDEAEGLVGHRHWWPLLPHLLSRRPH